MASPIDPEILQSIRRAHCDRGKDEAHRCIGTCTITPAGVELRCTLCGDGDELLTDSHRSDAALRVQAVLRAAGVDYDKLNIDAMSAAIEVMAAEACPGCRRLRTFDRTLSSTTFPCPCGEWYHNGAGWHRREAAG